MNKNIDKVFIAADHRGVGLKLYLIEKDKKPNILVIISTLIFPIGIILGMYFSIKYHKRHIIIG